MGNSMSSRRQPRAVAPRKVKNPNRFSFGSKKKRALQQQQAAAAASPRRSFGFGSKNRAGKTHVQAVPKKRFGFGGRNKAARHQQPVSTAPAAIQQIKAKISPSPAPVATKRNRKSNNSASGLAKRFGPIALTKAKSSGVGPFKKNHGTAPPPKRGLFSGLTSSRKRRY